MKIVAFVGESGSGKTRTISGLLREFKARGLAVAVIKHCGHGFLLDVEGKDSWLHSQAGAEGVALAADGEIAIFQHNARDEDFRGLARRYFPWADVVLVEGGKGVSGLKKVEVVRGSGASSPAIAQADELLAIVGQEATATGKPVFHPDDAAGLASHLLANMEDEMADIHLEVDGQIVLLNPFVRTFIEKTVLGMVTSLSGVPDEPRTITLSIKRDGDKG